MKIYAVRNLVNGKVYVGQTTQDVSRRWTAHKSFARNCRGNSPLYAAIRKHGWENFEVEVLEETDEAGLDMAERFWIDLYGSLAPSGYNLETGGNRNKRHSDVSRKRIAQANLGRRHSPETRALMSASAKALSPEFKAQRGKARAGRPLTPEHRLKLSEARKGERFATKLDWESVREIRRLYATGDYGQVELAERYRCGPTIIWGIVNNKKWIETDVPAKPARPGSRKLTLSEVREIRALYMDGKPSQRELAKQFGVTQGCISDIVTNKKWVESV